mgnify:CR=1 FL=1
MDAQDFLCDFCGRDWTAAAPFVEGHHGACICGDCLRAACAGTDTPCSFTCTMCRETRDALAHACADGPARLCTRCRDQSARTLQRDPDSGWRR